MQTSTVVVIGVVAVAGVGGLIYWQHSKAVQAAALAKAKSSSKSTTDKVVGTIASAVPILGSIVSLWA